MKTRFWFAFVLFEFLPLRNKSLVSADASPSSGWLASVVLSFRPILDHQLGDPFNDLAVVWSLAGTAVCPSLWFTKRKTPTLPSSNLHFFLLVSEPPSGCIPTPSSSSSSSFCVERMDTPLPVDGSSSAQERSWGCGRPSGSKCRSVSFWTRRQSTRAHTW